MPQEKESQNRTGNNKEGTPKPSANERRTSDRLRNIELVAWYRPAGTPASESRRTSFTLTPARVVDISPTGISIRLKEQLPSGQRIYVNLKFGKAKGAQEIAKLLCEVVRCWQATATEEADEAEPWQVFHTVGLRFLELNAGQKQLIEAFLRSNK